MKHYLISNKDSRILDEVVSSSDFKIPGAVLEHLIQNYAPKLIQSQGIVIDLQPAENGAYHTQKQWIELYNAQKGEFKGKRMISAPDVINAPDNVSSEMLASLQKDCIGEYVITGTHNSFKPHTYHKPLAGDVIHDYQSTVVRPKVISLDEIPVLQGESAKKVVETPEGLLYVRALADDRYAEPPTLLERLVALSQKEPENIFLWTPNQDSRRSYPEGAVRFCDCGGGFHVDGNDYFGDYVGRSRGVSISPRSGRAKK